MFSYDDKRGDTLLRVLSVSPVNGRHLWAPCLSGRSLGAQRVLRPAAGTDTPRSASKGPIGREPSPFIVGGDGEVFVSEPRYRHVPRHTALADNCSSRAAAAVFCFQHSLALPTAFH